MTVSLSKPQSLEQRLFHSRDVHPPNFASFKAKEIKGGHRAGVRCLGWNTDARRLASGGVDKTVRVWTPERSLDVRSSIELKGHTESVETLAWDPTHPERLATASTDKSVRLWDIRSGSSIMTTTTPGANINLSFHPKGQLLAVGDRNDILSLIDIRAGGKILGTIRPTPPQSKEEINEFSWNNSGSIFAATTGSGTVQILDARPHNDVAPPKIASESASAQGNSVGGHQAVSSSSPSQIASTASDDDTIPWKAVYTLEAHTATIFCSQFDPLGRYIITSSADATIGCWSMPEFFNVWMSSADFSYPSRSLSFSHDGEFIAAGGEDPFIWIGSSISGETIHKLPVSGTINALAWSSARHLLAYAGEEKVGQEGTIRIWGL